MIGSGDHILMVVAAGCSYITTSTGRLVASQEVLYLQTAPFHYGISIPLLHCPGKQTRWILVPAYRSVHRYVSAAD